MIKTSYPQPNIAMSVPQPTSSHKHHFFILGFICFVVYSFFAILKPIHIDEANFLQLTTGEFWRPHNIHINWQGNTQVAFDVLSNPPGIAWYLYPVRHMPIYIMRLWMILWSIFSLWGFWELGNISKQNMLFAVFAISSPVFALSHGAFLPDMPLLACTTIGYMLLLTRQNYFWGSFCIGLGFLFRYSAILPIASIILWSCIEFYKGNIDHKKIGMIFCSLFIPPLFLFFHDIWVYQKFHFWHMLSFQSIPKNWEQQMHQLLAIFAQGASGVFLTITWFAFQKSRFLFWIIFAAIGVFLSHSLWSGIWIATGIISLTFVPKNHTSRWAGFSLLCGILFLFGLRFTATRYWIALVPLLVLYLHPLFIQPIFRYSLVGSAILSAFLCLDDWEFADGYYKIALDIQKKNLQGSRAFAGHWGLQWYLEQQGFVPVEDDQPITQNWLLYAQRPWPQEGSQGTYRLEQSWYIDNRYIGPTILSSHQKAHFHANMIAPDIPTYASWGWGGDFFDQITLWSYCSHNCIGCLWDIKEPFPNCANK